MYMKYDPDITMFAKILKNELEEDFKFVHVKVKETILTLVKKGLREKYIHKGEQELDQIIENMKGSIIPDFLWKRILDQIYDSLDRMKVEDEIWKK